VAYIVGLLVVGLFALAIRYFTELSKRQELTVGVIVLSIIFGAIAFNTYMSSQNEKMLNAVIKYKQSKSITCDTVEVNNSNYTLSIGTYTFIGKENTPKYGEMISASTCE